MKKEDTTDEALDGIKQFLSERDIVNLPPMTRGQFEYIKLRLNNNNRDQKREICNMVGVPFFGDFSYEEYVATGPPPVVSSDGEVDYEYLNNYIDAKKTVIKGMPCILCESKKTEAHLIQLDVYWRCLPLCSECSKRGEDIKEWVEWYGLSCELSRDYKNARKLLEELLKVWPTLTTAISKVAGFETDEFAIYGFKKIEPDDSLWRKFTSDASTEIYPHILKPLMKLLQQLKG